MLMVITLTSTIAQQRMVVKYIQGNNPPWYGYHEIDDIQRITFDDSKMTIGFYIGKPKEYSFSEMVNVTFSQTPIVNSLGTKTDELFRLFPNPAKDNITFEWDNSDSQIELTIVDIQGKIVYKETIYNENDIMLDLSNWQSGIYFCYAKSNSLESTLKIIKQ